MRPYAIALSYRDGRGLGLEYERHVALHHRVRGLWQFVRERHPRRPRDDVRVPGSVHYLECAACKALQLLDVPADLSRYYPRDYYSFAPSGALKNSLRQRRSAYAHGTRGVSGWLAEQMLGPDYAMRAIRRARIPFDARVLDVGCGSGHLIRGMAGLGYRHTCGLDPFLEADLHYPDGVTVWKRSIDEMDGAFDVVMSHHAFEHMPAPARALSEMRRLLAPGGRILVRIPVADSHAWRRYGVNRVNLDAPRHLFLHTPDSMKRLAEQTSLTISDIVFEGNASQFIASDQYERDGPLADPRSVYSGGLRRWVGVWQAHRLAARVAKLNQPVRETGPVSN